MRNHRALVNRARKTTETLIATDVTEKIFIIISVESVLSVLSVLSVVKIVTQKSQKTVNLTRMPSGVRMFDPRRPGVFVAGAPRPRANGWHPSGMKIDVGWCSAPFPLG